jgi:hypothetical protein
VYKVNLGYPSSSPPVISIMHVSRFGYAVKILAAWDQHTAATKIERE